MPQSVKVFPMVSESKTEVSLGQGPTESMANMDTLEEDERRTRHASAYLHKGPLPEILQDIYECPPGLEPLADTDFITIESQIEPEEMLMGYDSDYRFQILNHEEERIYLAGKISQWKTKHIFWRSNSYEIHAMNFEGAGIFSILCQASCCKDVIKVYLEDGLLGILTSECKMYPSIDIKDDDGTLILQTVMTSCPCFNCYSGPATFEIRILGTKNNIGKIEQLGKKLHTNAEYYTINFRKDINIRVKVMLIAALFHVGSRFLNTRYATLERRVHADIIQETDDVGVLNAIADEDSTTEEGSRDSIHDGKDSDKKRESSARRESDKENERKDSEQERVRKLFENQKAKRELGIQQARKLSAQEKEKARAAEEEAKTKDATENAKPEMEEVRKKESSKLKAKKKESKLKQHMKDDHPISTELPSFDLPDAEHKEAINRRKSKAHKSKPHLIKSKAKHHTRSKHSKKSKIQIP